MLRPVCPRPGEDERAGAARAMLPPKSSPAHLGTPRGLPGEVLAQKQPLGIHTDCTKGEQEWAFFFFFFPDSRKLFDFRALHHIKDSIK